MRLYEPEDGGGRMGAALRWGAAGLLVAGVHLGTGLWLASHPFAAPPPPDRAQGIPIDLEPVAEPQNAPTPSSAAAAGPAPAPQAAAAPEPSQMPELPATEPRQDVGPPPPEPTQLPEQALTPPPIEPTAEPLPPAVPLPPPREVKSDAVLAAPPPPPKAPPKPDPRVLAREAAKRKALAEQRDGARAERAEARAAARAQHAQARAAQAQEGGGAASAAATPSAAASGAALATWHGAIVAHIRRFQPSWSGASGTALVSLVVDQNGRVLSAGIARGSGDLQVDQSAVAMVRRASPVPPPPPGSGNRFNFAIPVHFASSGKS